MIREERMERTENEEGGKRKEETQEAGRYTRGLVSIRRQ